MASMIWTVQQHTNECNINNITLICFLTSFHIITSKQFAPAMTGECQNM